MCSLHPYCKIYQILNFEEKYAKFFEDFEIVKKFWKPLAPTFLKNSMPGSQDYWHVTESDRAPQLDLTFGLFICHTISFCPNFPLLLDCRIFPLISWQLLTRPRTCRVAWARFWCYDIFLKSKELENTVVWASIW